MGVVEGGGWLVEVYWRGNKRTKDTAPFYAQVLEAKTEEEAKAEGEKLRKEMEAGTGLALKELVKKLPESGGGTVSALRAGTGTGTGAKQ